MDLAMLVSNFALVLVTLIMAGVDWHKDNALVSVVKAFLNLRVHDARRCSKKRHHHKNN